MQAGFHAYTAAMPLALVELGLELGQLADLERGEVLGHLGRGLHHRRALVAAQAPIGGQERRLDPLGDLHLAPQRVARRLEPPHAGTPLTDYAGGDPQRELSMIFY